MGRPVREVGALDALGDAGTRPSGPRDQLDMGQIARVRLRILVVGQEPERAQLVEREACRQQRLFRDRGVLEHVVKPGDYARMPGDRGRDPLNVFDQRRPASVALPVVKPFG